MGLDRFIKPVRVVNNIIGGDKMSRFDRGWFRVDRRMASEDIGQNPICLALWTWLLATASIKESKVRWKGQMKVIPSGTSWFSITALSEQWDISKTTIYRHLQYLAESERIRYESGTRGCLVTICNWKKYQEDWNFLEHESNARVTPAERQSNARVTVLNKEQETINNKQEEDICSDANKFAYGAIQSLRGNSDIEKSLEKTKQKTQELWLQTYPEVDWVISQLLKAIAWISVNPQKAPKKFDRFMNNWLSTGWENYRKTKPSVLHTASTNKVNEPDEEQKEWRRIMAVYRGNAK